MASRVSVRWVEGEAVRLGSADDLARVPAHAPLWVDVVEPDAETLAVLTERFRLPPLAVEDCLHFPQRPKYDVYEHVTFIIWLVPHEAAEDGIGTSELDIFLGPEFLVTLRHEPDGPAERVAARAETYLVRGVEWTLHAILDEAVDDMFPITERLSDALEELEDAMLERAHPEQLERLHAMRRRLLALHKLIVPESEVIRGLARLDAFVAPEAYMYFQDIGDHLAGLADTVDTYRDVAAAAMDVYLSSVNNRMNAVMKQLTVIATIFMPLTLITGIYGMNFRYLPELEWRHGYFLVLAAMALITGSMLIAFKRRGWW